MRKDAQGSSCKSKLAHLYLAKTKIKGLQRKPFLLSSLQNDVIIPALFCEHTSLRTLAAMEQQDGPAASAGVHWSSKARPTCWPVAHGHLHKALLKWRIMVASTPPQLLLGLLQPHTWECNTLNWGSGPEASKVTWTFLQSKDLPSPGLVPKLFNVPFTTQPQKCVLINTANAF